MTTSCRRILLGEVTDDLYLHIASYGQKANVIAPQIIKARSQPPNPEEFLLVWQDGKREFILAVTKNTLGPYPIFIITNRPNDALTDSTLSQPLGDLADMLQQSVEVTRVYSVFGQKPLTIAFCNAWKRLTGISTCENPYYDAKLSYCSTLRQSQISINPAGADFQMRLATTNDLQGVAELCYAFASDSEPFTLTRERALREATYLINNNIVWVLIARQSANAQPMVASIVATTRNTPNVATITKVMTGENWRGRKYAEHLVRFVTSELLTGGHSCVALYVANDNRAAIKVYDRVGFVGLNGDSAKYQDVDDWVEYGFDRKKVTLGHW